MKSQVAVERFNRIAGSPALVVALALALGSGFLLGWTVWPNVVRDAAHAAPCDDTETRNDDVGIQNNWDDSVDGEDEVNRWFGGGANDDLFALACIDEAVEGQGDRDFAGGGSGTDIVRGGDDNDIVQGGAAGDSLHGGKGRDDINDVQGGFEIDAAFGNEGDDEINLDDGDDDDFLYGGPDQDLCQSDPGDSEDSC